MALQRPLLLLPSPKPRVWGGSALAGCIGLEFDDSVPIGEVWTLADREESSTEIAAGEFQGRLLRGLMLSEREDLLGDSKLSKEGSFPLLLKLLNAGRDLSVQVHPDANSAALLGDGAEAKDEFWYILDAPEGARIYLGLKPGVDSATFAAKADGPEVVDLLQEFPIRRGDCVMVPAGTVHSIGAGITLFEVQQNSDTTYRVYDWGRLGLDGQPRECHLDKALKAIDYDADVPGPYRAVPATNEVNPRTLLVDSPYFGVEHLSVHAPLEHDTSGRAWAFLVLSGRGQLAVDGVPGEWDVKRGETWLLPASLGRYRFHSLDGDFKVLRIEAKS